MLSSRKSCVQALVTSLLCAVSLFADSTVTLTSTANPAAFGQDAFLMVNAPAGTVTLYDGPVVLAVLQITPYSLGVALSTQMLGSGTHSIRAYYSGDATHHPGTSNVLQQVITPVPVLGLSFLTSSAPGYSPLFLGIGGQYSPHFRLGVGTNLPGKVAVYDELNGEGWPTVGQGPNRIAILDLVGGANADLIVNRPCAGPRKFHWLSN